ncbi:MAG TPA: hypothetical protein VGR73_02885 [Bryobacteraceae bacterium]|nr:hypothetical protein [Bryobacteraceae bacterium]
MRSSVVLVVALGMGSASCWFRHPPRAFVPPPPRTRPFVLPPMPELPEPPLLEVKSDAELPPEVASEIPVLPPPPAPPKRPPVVATPKPVPPPVPVEPPPSPRLGQIFTAEQLRDYNRALDESLARVRAVLAIAANKSLTAQQAGMVTRIRTFVMQAEQTRQQDLVTAVSLAKRADLLAQDLAERLP